MRRVANPLIIFSSMNILILFYFNIPFTPKLTPFLVIIPTYLCSAVPGFCTDADVPLGDGKSCGVTLDPRMLSCSPCGLRPVLPSRCHGLLSCESGSRCDSGHIHKRLLVHEFCVEPDGCTPWYFPSNNSDLHHCLSSSSVCEPPSYIPP